MAHIPRAILSDQFEEQLKGRRLIAAVFLTFRFDPEFFEQEVLPVFLDVPLSHAAAIRLVQLEDGLRDVPDGVAVYYDQNGLVPEAGPAKLDVRRIPVRLKTGIFHPKNVFALVEDREPPKEGEAPHRALLVGNMSANLTRAGWWENVEVCHIEEIGEGETNRLRGDLLSFLDGLMRRVGSRTDDRHEALRSIRAFLAKTSQRANRSSGGALYSHFYSGQEAFTDFLRDAAGRALDDMYLEIISPYFDGGPSLAPLQSLMEAFRPKQVQVFLPRDRNGDVLCSQEVFEWVQDQDEVTWAEFPPDIVRGGKSQDAARRMVHAKVYRFFSKRPAREIIFVGSVNLTRAAHQRGGNLESGILVEVPAHRAPDWWLNDDTAPAGRFAEHIEDEGDVAMSGTCLAIRYWWNRGMGEAFWDATSPSPELSIRAQDIERFRLAPLKPREWTPLSEEASRELEQILQSTSLLKVIGEQKEPGLLLVQEEGMSHRPSLLWDLSPAQILRFWSLLTPAQRAAFLENIAPEAALAGDGAALVSRYVPLSMHDSFFDRFAGIFLGFGNLERAVRKALAEDRVKDAVYLVFGQKYDSLGSLLKRVAKDSAEGKGDLVDHYVIVMCAEQFLKELRRDHADFWQEHAEDATLLKEELGELSAIRARLIERNPSEMPAFLDWFDKWFLRRAAPVATEAA